MSRVKVTDRAGKTLTLVEIDGQYYTPFSMESIQHGFKFKARPDDVIVCAYPKCGTHWTYEIIRFLREGTTDLPLKEKIEDMIESAAPSHLDSLPSPRNINSHFYSDKISQDVFHQRSKIIYVTRDPRDVATSFYNHHKKFTIYYDYDGGWDDYLPLFLEGKVDTGSWFDYTKNWEQATREHPDHPFLLLVYEDMLKDPLNEIKKIAAFIGVERSDAFLNEVTEKTRFDSMRQRRQKEDNPKHVNSKIIFRKGKMGDWKDWFTVSQLEQFNDVFEREMKGTHAYTLYSHTAGN